MMPAAPGEDGPGGYGADYGYFRARLARRGPLRYDWWAGRFTARLVRRYRRGGRLLEIGCGLGHTLRLLEPYFETHGIDVSAFAVETARRVAPRSRVTQMDAADLSAFEGQAFDAIVAAHVLEHLDRPGETLRQCGALLAPGGVLVCWMPNTESIGRRRKGERWFGFRDAGHVSLLSPAEWRELIGAAGLRVVREFGDGLWDAPYVGVVPAGAQRLFLLLPALVQFAVGRPLVPARCGEDVGMVAVKAG